MHGAIFTHDELHGHFQIEGRLQKFVDDRLRQNMRDAHDQTQGLCTTFATLEHPNELAAEAKNLVGVPQRDAPRMGERQLPPFAVEKRFADHLFKLVDLTA